jgi:hypothetical protein
VKASSSYIDQRFDDSRAMFENRSNDIFRKAEAVRSTQA